MATHSDSLAWRIPWTEETGRLQSTGSQWVEHDWSDFARKPFSLWPHHFTAPPRISVQFSSVAQSCLTLCDPMNCTRQASLSITNSRNSLKTHVHRVGDAILSLGGFNFLHILTSICYCLFYFSHLVAVNICPMNVSSQEEICDWQIFSPVAYAFTFLILSFETQSFKFDYFYFLLSLVLLASYLRNHWLMQDDDNLLLMF